MITLTGLLETTLSAGIVILAVCLLSKPLKGRYQSKYRKTIWLLIALRLLIPVSSPIRPWTLHIPLKSNIFSSGSSTDHEAISNNTFVNGSSADKTSSNEAFPNTALSDETSSNGTLSDETSSNETLSDETLSNKTFSDEVSTNKTASGNNPARYRHPENNQAKNARQSDRSSISAPVKLQRNQEPNFIHALVENIIQSVSDLNRKIFPSDRLILNIWAAGAAIFAIFHIICYMIFRKKLAAQEIPCTDSLLQTAAQAAAEIGIRKLPDIKLLPHADSAPFLAGIIHPRLILPKDSYPPEDLSFILKHELTHYAQKDIWYKLLITAVHILHWFNPLVWIMHSAADSDLEKSCDEAVLNGMSYDQRKAYSEVILSCISKHNAFHPFLSTGYAVRTKQIKDRFANILDYPQKQTAACSILGAAFLIFFSSGLIHITHADSSSTQLSIMPPAQNNAAQTSGSAAQNNAAQTSGSAAQNNAAQTSGSAAQNNRSQFSKIIAEDAADQMEDENSYLDDFDKERTLERYSLLGLSIGDGQDAAVNLCGEPADRFYEVIGTAGNTPQCLHTYMFYNDCMIIVKDFFEKNTYEEQNGIFEVELSGRHRSYKTSKGIRVGDSLKKSEKNIKMKTCVSATIPNAA